MRTFYIPPFAAAVIFSVLVMGVIGAGVVLPIVCINWSWNSLVSAHTALPEIEIWQACLLYMATACVAYLSGLVQIEFKAETVD